LLSEKSYRHQSQTIPVNFLICVALVFVVLLLALPFLKIFVLSFHENINIADVRFIISVIFIIPFVVTLGCSAIWLYKYPESLTNDVLSSLQHNITDNLNDEINLTIRQAKEYNRIIDNPKVFAYKRDSSIFVSPGRNGVDITLYYTLASIKTLRMCIGWMLMEKISPYGTLQIKELLIST
jgi:hypothetical protein